MKEFSGFKQEGSMDKHEWAEFPGVIHEWLDLSGAMKLLEMVGMMCGGAEEKCHWCGWGEGGTT